MQVHFHLLAGKIKVIQAIRRFSFILCIVKPVIWENILYKVADSGLGYVFNIYVW